jgi:hypothetical protein
LYFISLMCSLNLVLKLLPLFQVNPQFNLYNPLLSYIYISVLFLHFVLIKCLPSVLKVLNTIFILCSFKSLVTDSTSAQLYVKEARLCVWLFWLLRVSGAFLSISLILSTIFIWRNHKSWMCVDKYQFNRALRTNNTQTYTYTKISNNYYNVLFGDRWLHFNVVVWKIKTEVLRRGTPAVFKSTSLDKLHFSSYSSTTTNEISEKHPIIHKVLRSVSIL